jgi:hypothetical protein
MGRVGAVSGEACRRGERRQESEPSQYRGPHPGATGAVSKAALRERRQEGGDARTGMRQSESETPSVPKRATQGVNPPERSWSWVEVSVWNERMLAALVNGVKGGKWFSLSAGRMHSSLSMACSRSPQPMHWRANLDEGTTDWRAVCGRTARTVRRAGRASPFPTPIFSDARCSPLRPAVVAHDERGGIGLGDAAVPESGGVAVRVRRRWGSHHCCTTAEVALDIHHQGAHLCDRVT